MLLTLVVRPVLVGLLLLPIDLSRGERVFVAWSGLKGAVPILLGTYILSAHAADGARLYQIVVVVVAFSVIVQGGRVPVVAHRARVPMRVLEPEPWALGTRFRHEPTGLRRFQITAGAPPRSRSARRPAQVTSFSVARSFRVAARARRPGRDPPSVEDRLPRRSLPDRP